MTLRPGVKPQSKVDNCTTKIKPYRDICPIDISKRVSMSTEINSSFLIGDYVSAHKKNVLVRGYVDFYGGYASHTRETIRHLDETGAYNIKLNQLACPIDLHPVDFNKMNWYIHNPAFTSKNYLYLSIAGPGYLQKEYLPSNSEYNFGWTMIETVGVQPQIVEWCNNVDMVFAPTHPDVKKFRDAGVSNVELMRIGYDDALYNLGTPRMDIVNLRNRYVFGVVGSWNYRKGVEEIVTAYCQEFNKNDPVALLLLCKYGNRPFGPHKDDDNYWGIQYELDRLFEKNGFNKSDCPQISVIDVPLHPCVMASAFARIDSLVGFSAGESTWLPGLEALALNKPVIQLNNGYAGYIDYLQYNPFMCSDIEYKVCDERLYEGTSEYYKDQTMCFGNTEELQSIMRELYIKHGSPLLERSTQELRRKIENYSWKSSISQLHKRLSSI